MRMTARHLLLVAVGCAVVFAAIFAAAYYTSQGRWLDNAALDGFLSALAPGRQTSVASAVAHLCDPAPFLLLAAGVIALALLRRSPRRAAAAAALMLASAGTTQLLKPLLAEYRFDDSLIAPTRLTHPLADSAFPSGHATAAMSLALAALIVVPRAWRPATAAAGSLFALAVSFSIVALAWHYPSDIVGGYLIASTWCLVALATLRAADARWPEPGTIRAAARSRLPTAVAPAAAIAAAALVAALARLDCLVGFAGDHTAATVAAVGMSLSAATLVAAVSLADRRAR